MTIPPPKPFPGSYDERDDSYKYRTHENLFETTGETRALLGLGKKLNQ